jgi:hypothetical protein
MLRLVVVATMMIAAVSAQVACDEDATAAATLAFSNDCGANPDDYCLPACQTAIDSILDHEEVVACIAATEDAQTLNVLMQLRESCAAATPQVDCEATVATIVSQYAELCQGISAGCAEPCQTFINGTLHNNDAVGCLYNSDSYQLLSTFSSMLGCQANNPPPISEGSSSGDSSSGDSSSGSESTPDEPEAECDATAFSDVLAGVEADCSEETKCSSGCQAHVNTILGNEDIQVCFGDEDSRAQMMAGFQQVKAQCGSASAVSVAAVAVVAAAALLL